MADARFRGDLPQQRDSVLLTDGGLETTLVFDHGVDLPAFASFPLLESAEGRELLAGYFRSYLDIARRVGAGIVLETPTWRANSDWGAVLGYDDQGLDGANRAAVGLLEGLRDEYPDVTIVISGNLGPRGDGYVPGALMSPAEATDYHRRQIATFAAAGADLVTILTANYVEEAVGVVLAARAEDMPVVVSFTVETDGRLPSGQELGDAVAAVDGATDAYAVSYGINCAHPDHVLPVLSPGAAWAERIGLLRANASRLSHAELDEAEELDSGDPLELGAAYAALRERFPTLRVIGGCCGTDHRHVGAIADACVAG